MPTLTLRRLLGIAALLATTMAAQTQDLHIKKNILVGGNFISSTDSSIKGARERSVTQGPNGSTITLRQCDLKRTITLNDQQQTYLVVDDPQDENAAKAAALATGTAASEAAGGKIVVTTTVTDTGERKTMYGLPARHLKAKVVQEPSQDACTQVRQTFEIDGWFADISRERAACETFAPPVQQGSGCHDAVISRRTGSGKPGYALQESITMPTPDGGTVTVGQQISELTRQNLPAEIFEVPAGYRQVQTLAELNGGAAQPQAAQAAGAPQMQAGVAQSGGAGQVAGGANGMKATMLAATLNPAAAPAAQMKANAMASQTLGMLNGIQMGPGMMGPGAGQPGANQVAAPQAVGPKAPGKIRIGVAPPDAQLGQGNNAGADYSTPIRNAEVALMSGPAIEIAALDSHVPMQLQAEAQQKQCDYILLSSVAVKHSSGGGFGKFAKFGGVAASMTPVAGMAHGMGGAAAASAASVAASAAAQSAQQQVVSQLAGFNGQIKSKDDVTVQYQLVATGQSSPVAQKSLAAKAKSDGEDVLTPLLQQTANEVLTQVSSGKK